MTGRTQQNGYCPGSDALIHVASNTRSLYRPPPWTRPGAAEWRSDQARFRLFDGVNRSLTELARPAGLATYRDTEVQRGDRFFATLSSLAREATTHRLMLRGLAPSAPSTRVEWDV
jgi:hypothetical protein